MYMARERLRVLVYICVHREIAKGDNFIMRASLGRYIVLPGNMYHNCDDIIINDARACLLRARCAHS